MTKDEVTEFGVYVSDSSIKTAVKAVEVVGKTLDQAFNDIATAIAEAEKLPPKEAKALKDVAQEVVKNPKARKQLIACAGQRSSLDGLIFEWLIPKAYAAGSCTIDTLNGPVRLNASQARKLLQIIRAGAAEFITGAGVTTAVATATLAAIILIATTTTPAQEKTYTLKDGSTVKIYHANGDISSKATVTTATGQVIIITFDSDGPISGVRNGQSISTSALSAAWNVVHSQSSGDNPGIGHSGGPPLDAETGGGNKHNEPQHGPLITLTAAAIAHILDGNLNNSGEGSGGHYERSGNIEIGEVLNPPDTNGVYEARIKVRDPKTGRFVPKDRPSTFFPRNWSRRQVQQEIEGAFRNKDFIQGSLWRGRSPSGVRIEGRLQNGNITTAYPKYGN